MGRYIAWALAGAIVMGIALAARATPSITFYEDWEPAGDVYGWTDTGPAVLSNPSGYLQIRFPSREGPPPPVGPPTSEQDIAYNTGAAYTGSYEQDGLALRFEFLADDIVPTSLQVYMLANQGTADERAWLYGFSVTQIDTWFTFEVAFDYNYGNGWAGGTEDQFNDDLGDIDAIGIVIQSAVDFGEQKFGLDMWKYFIPEPATWCLIATALLSAGIPLRRMRKAEC